VAVLFVLSIGLTTCLLSGLVWLGSGITPGGPWYTGAEVPVMQKLAWFLIHILVNADPYWLDVCACHLAGCACYADMESKPEFLLAWNRHTVLILVCAYVLVWFCDLFCWPMLALQLMLAPLV
jgi:hypothetical protein